MLFAVILLYLLTYDSDKSQSKGILMCMMLSLALFVGMSDMLGGYDRYIYCELFDSLCDSKAFGVPLHDTAVKTKNLKRQENNLLRFIVIKRTMPGQPAKSSLL